MFFYLIVAILVLIYYISTRKFDYWKKRNVPHLRPTFLFGNYGDVFLQKKNIGVKLQELCKQFPNDPYFGAYYGTEPVLIPRDPELIKLIVTKDFYYFNGRDLSEHNHKEPASRNLLVSHGDSWRVLRQNMTPLFSSAKMKSMFHLLEKCSHAFESMLDREMSISKQVEIRSFAARYTIECIVACGFGVNANTLGERGEDNPFKKIASFTEPPTYVGVLRIMRTVWPSIFYGLGFKILRGQIGFFNNLITNVINQRQNKASPRNDFVDLVLGWKQSKKIVGDSMRNIKTGESKKVELDADDDLLVAQCFVFFTAGFETSSTTLSYTLFELAKHREIQDRVLEEVDAYLARHENKLNHSCVTELPYLEACIDEALRLYPILSMITREVMDDYTLPGGVRIEKGLRVQLPVYYLHHSPEFYPEPEVFRPERFLGDEKWNINQYAYLPFGEGPRACIGMRFAKMQMMAGLVTMLKKYRLELADDMPRTVTFKPQTFVTHPVGGIRLKFVERDGWEDRVFVK